MHRMSKPIGVLNVRPITGCISIIIPTMKSFLRIYLIIVVLLAALPFPIQPAHGQSALVDVYAIIDRMNALRVGNGYPALVIDDTLMYTAQVTAEIMAANGACSHLGNVRGRVAAAGYGNGETVFATENIACGYFDLDGIYVAWNDPDHMLPATTSWYKNIGAAVALSAEGYPYYVLHAAYIAGGLANPTPLPGAPTQIPAQSISQYIAPVTIATPRSDGYIVHQVASGQSLWLIAIAYGVKIADIISRNALPETDTTIYVNQKLVIDVVPTYTPSPEPSITPTVLPHTPTPKPTLIPSPTASLTPTFTATPAILLPKLDGGRRMAGWILLGICVVGLALVVLGAFLRKPPTEN